MDQHGTNENFKTKRVSMPIFKSLHAEGYVSVAKVIIGI